MECKVIYNKEMNRDTGLYFKDTIAGRVLIAETNEGICSVIFGISDDAMLAEMRSVFPSDNLSLKSGSSPDTVPNIISGKDASNLMLDIRTGTGLQQRVWIEIMKIPRGKTISYGELAYRVGKPDAWRAVATACGRNIIAYIIPCHRVVSKNPGKMNYRWGSDIKKKLLELERNE